MKVDHGAYLLVLFMLLGVVHASQKACDCMNFAAYDAQVNAGQRERRANVIAVPRQKPLPCARKNVSPSLVILTTVPKPAMVSRVT